MNTPELIRGKTCPCDAVYQFVYYSTHYINSIKTDRAARKALQSRKLFTLKSSSVGYPHIKYHVEQLRIVTAKKRMTPKTLAQIKLTVILR